MSNIGKRLAFHEIQLSNCYLPSNSDTMNTTARIEATGMANAIHASRETAKLLSDAGKGHWLVRDESEILLI